MVTLSLKILRGIDLMAKDKNILIANSSDPYCLIYVNDKQIAWTPVKNQTLNPIWGGPKSTFRFLGGGMTKITIKLFDYDELSQDDPMGQVEFYASDVLKKIKYYPNVWYPVEPLNGCGCSGKIELRLMSVCKAYKNNAFDTAGGLKLYAGPKLSNASQEELVDDINLAKAPVILNVYDVGSDPTLKTIARINTPALLTGKGGGVFHGAIEVYGKEYSYGGSRQNITGVFTCHPRKCSMHTYRQSLYLGDCELDPDQIDLVINKMKPEWMAPNYNLLRNNCVFFSKELAIELGVSEIPKWVYNLANVGASLENMLSKSGSNEMPSVNKSQNTSNLKEHIIEETYENNPCEDITLDYIMAVRLQSQFRLVNAKRRGNQIKEYGINSALRTRWASEGEGFEIEGVIL